MSAAVRYQYMPPLSPEEYMELEGSIQRHGVMVPVLRDANGVMVDGHHRLKIAESLGLDCPSEYLDRPEAELRTLAFELNLNRRHLTQEQRRALVEESIKADPQLSSREHGRRTGVDHKTAERVRESLSSRGEIPHVDSRTGGDGKVYPPPSALDPFTAQGERASKPPRPTRAARTDVIATVNRALLRAQEAARAADEISRQHLNGRTEEATTWGRSLSTSLESLNRLQGLLKEIGA